MNFETSQASRSKHELHIEHEHNLILLSLWSRSENALTVTSCGEREVQIPLGTLHWIRDFPENLGI